MSYSKGIVVQYRGDINIGVIDSSIPNSSYLSDFDLRSINEIVLDLRKLLESDGGGFIWGQEQIMIDSTSEVSFCEDVLNKEVLPDIPTISLLKLMIEIQKIKKEYQNPDNLKKIIGKAFTIIKSNPENYKRWPESNTDFSTIINDIQIALVIGLKGFELTESEYVKTLNTNFY